MTNDGDHREAGAGLLLCFTGGKPSLMVVDARNGSASPFASPADRAQIAIDHIHRCGDGIILDAHMDYYGIDAALQGPMFDLGRFGFHQSAVTRWGLWRRSGRESFELVSWNGQRVRSQRVPAGWSVVAETGDGVIVNNGAMVKGRGSEDEYCLVDEGGAQHPVPGEGRVCAATDRYVVRIAQRGRLNTVDLQTGATSEISAPDGIESWWDLDVPADPSGTRVALSGYAPRTAEERARYRRPTIMCVLELDNGVLRVGARVDGPQHPVWSADGRSVFVGDVNNDRLWVVDSQTMDSSLSPAGRHGSSPKVDVGDAAPPLGAIPNRVWLHGEATNEIPRSKAAANADFESRLQGIEDPGLRDRLRQAASLSVRLVRSGVQRKRSGSGHTKVGGRPDLPKGTRWPTANGAALAFIGQVDLEAVSWLIDSPLPKRGLLLLFYGPFLDGVDYPAEEHSSVVYAPADAPLTRRAWPARLPSEARYQEVYLEPAVETTVPLTALDLADGEVGRVEEAMQSRIAGPLHRVGGDPDPIQDFEMGDLLMQIGSDTEAGFVWGDDGILYFTVPDRDTLTEDFSTVEAHVEST